jgi:hypothetical protein
MLTSLMNIFALFGVAAILAAGTLYIAKMGPGLRTRRVNCPLQHVDADVTFVLKESGFGGLRVADVAKCSLLPEGEVTCEKACR